MFNELSQKIAQSEMHWQPPFDCPTLSLPFLPLLTFSLGFLFLLGLENDKVFEKLPSDSTFRLQSV